MSTEDEIGEDGAPNTLTDDAWEKGSPPPETVEQDGDDDD